MSEQAGHVLLGTDIADRHAEELFARIAVESDRGVVDREKRQRLEIVDPHRLRVGFEELAVARSARRQLGFEVLEPGDVGPGADDVAASRAQRAAALGPEPQVVAVPVPEAVIIGDQPAGEELALVRHELSAVIGVEMLLPPAGLLRLLDRIAGQVVHIGRDVDGPQRASGATQQEEDDPALRDPGFRNRLLGIHPPTSLRGCVHSGSSILSLPAAGRHHGPCDVPRDELERVAGDPRRRSADFRECEALRCGKVIRCTGDRAITS